MTSSDGPRRGRLQRDSAQMGLRPAIAGSQWDPEQVVGHEYPKIWNMPSLRSSWLGSSFSSRRLEDFPCRVQVYQQDADADHEIRPNRIAPQPSPRLHEASALNWSHVSPWHTISEMHKSSIQSVIALVLCWAHLAAALAGPASVLLCRDIDGTSHVERSSVRCCSTVSEGHGQEGSLETFWNNDFASQCSGESCVDEPLAAAESIVIRSTQRVDYEPATPLPSLATAFAFDFFPDAQSRFAVIGKRPCGPPTHIVETLRATILIV